MQESTSADLRNKSFLYFIWKSPYMLASQDTYISRGMQMLGLCNLAPTSSRYPAVNEEELQELRPDFVFLSTEPYPFRKRDVPALREVLPKAEFLKADGQLWSWYGSQTYTLLQEMLALQEGRQHLLWKEF